MGLLFVLSLIPAVMCGECEVDWNSLQVQGNFQFDRVRILSGRFKRLRANA